MSAISSFTVWYRRDWVLFQTLHHDPIQIVSDLLYKLCRSRAAAGRYAREQFVSKVLSIVAMVVRGSSVQIRSRNCSMLASASSCASNGVVSGQQLIQQHAETVDVAARVDGCMSGSRLFRTDVRGRAHDLIDLSMQRLIDHPSLERLGDSEVDDFCDAANRRASSPERSMA